MKNPKGKSFLFLTLLICGYLAGICGKIISGKVDYVIFLYILNLLMISADLALSLYYKKQVELAEQASGQH